MKKQIYAVFSDIDVADQAINELHTTAGIATDEISYVYRNADGDKVSGTAEDIAEKSPAEGAADGATVGGVIGAALGLVASFGLVGPLGVVAAGPLAVALGLTGATAGALAGGLVGALTNLGLSEPVARKFSDRVESGHVLVSVHTDDDEAVLKVLEDHNASDVEILEEDL